MNRQERRTAWTWEVIREWVVRLATENRSWGYTRIQAALANLVHHVSRGSIGTNLKQHAVEPAPERPRRTTRQELLDTHHGVVAALTSFRSKRGPLVG